MIYTKWEGWADGPRKHWTHIYSVYMYVVRSGILKKKEPSWKYWIIEKWEYNEIAKIYQRRILFKQP